jgi:hypothetical protein
MLKGLENFGAGWEAALDGGRLFEFDVLDLHVLAFFSDHAVCFITCKCTVHKMQQIFNRLNCPINSAQTRRAKAGRRTVDRLITNGRRLDWQRAYHIQTLSNMK